MCYINKQLSGDKGTVISVQVIGQTNQNKHEMYLSTKAKYVNEIGTIHILRIHVKGVGGLRHS